MKTNCVDECNSVDSACHIINKGLGTSLVVQWLRIPLPVQGMWVRCLGWEDSSYCRLCATTTEACMPRCEKPDTATREQPVPAPRESRPASVKTQHSHKWISSAVLLNVSYTKPLLCQTPHGFPSHTQDDADSSRLFVTWPPASILTLALNDFPSVHCLAVTSLLSLG